MKGVSLSRTIFCVSHTICRDKTHTSRYTVCCGWWCCMLVRNSAYLRHSCHLVRSTPSETCFNSSCRDKPHQHGHFVTRSTQSPYVQPDLSPVRPILTVGVSRSPSDGNCHEIRRGPEADVKPRANQFAWGLPGLPTADPPHERRCAHPRVAFAFFPAFRERRWGGKRHGSRFHCRDR